MVAFLDVRADSPSSFVSNLISIKFCCHRGSRAVHSSSDGEGLPGFFVPALNRGTM